jgi:DNA-binding winged helix-turn-helix (wHTH) protein/TolB-like protein
MFPQHTSAPGPHIALEEFVFDPVTGELGPRDGADQLVRLAPKPAALLQLLIEAHPELVSHQTIRETLWPDVEVDYDQSVHYCVRQIRAALGDSASSPRFVETMPRRGYRLICTPPTVPASEPGSTPAAASEETPMHSAARRGRPFIVLAAAATLLTVAIFAGWWAERSGGAPGNLPGSEGTVRAGVEADQHGTARRALRIGIMPFEPLAGEFDAARAPLPNSVAELLLEQLQEAAETRQGTPDAFELIGPTSTTPLTRRGSTLADIVAELHLDYLVNGRFLDQPAALLAELIRADGAHVWVHRFERFPADPDTVETIARGVLKHLEEGD